MYAKPILVTAIAAAALAAMTLAAEAEPVKITIVAGHPPVFRWVKHASKTFIPAVNKALEGSGVTVKWDQQWGGSVAKVGDELESVEEGLAEVGLVLSLFDPAKLSLQNVSYYTPFVSADPIAVAGTINNMHFKEAKMRSTWEENGLEYLGGSVGVDDYFLMTKFPVKTLADLKGRKIAAPGPAVNWLSGTGAVGVAGNLTLYYNSLKTGVYDGVIVFASAALPGKLYEVAPYITKVGFGAQYAGALAANKAWYAAQPKVLQKALKAGAEAFLGAYHTDLNKAVEFAFKTMAAKGAIISEVSAAFRQKWADGMDNVAQAWAAQIDTKGKPGSEVLKIYMDAMRAAGAKPLRDWDKK